MKKIGTVRIFIISIILCLAKRGIIKLDDETFLKMLYQKRMNKVLNINNPQTFNEKLQWLKIHDKKDIYTQMVDKYEVKSYVSNIIGDEYIIPTLGVWDSFEDIDFDKLPNQFVLKCTHDSGGLVICEDKSKMDKLQARKKIENALKFQFYCSNREWPYKNVKPRVIVEKYMSTEEQKELIDYKFFCFNGTPKFIYVSQGLSDHSTAKISFADINYNKADFYRKDFKPFDELPSKPINFEKMKELASKLSKDIPFVRVDFYEIDGKIYFGELTFFPCGGFIPFEPQEYDLILGNMLELPKEKKNEK